METTITKKIPMAKGSTSYKIIIPDKVERLIRFLCERVWDTEWSGVLFYTPTGAFEDGTLEIRCEDILPMDVGTTTYTEFNMSPDVISYMAQKPELLDCKTGLIHSHNNMSTFFSGTDLNTLQEEGSERNHFVSLIVNNAGKYTAAITRKIKYTSVREFSYESFNGIVSNGNKETLEGEEIEYFNLDIVFEESSDNQMQEIASRIAEIKKAKQKTIPATATKATTVNLSSYYGYPRRDNDILGYVPPKKQPTLFDDDSFWETNYKDDKKEVSYKDLKKAELVESIVCQLITGDVTRMKLKENSLITEIREAEKAFEKRFGKGDEGMLQFEYWATDFIEFLTWYSIDDTDGESSAEDIVECVIESLEKLPVKNKYIDRYLEILNSYVTKF